MAFHMTGIYQVYTKNEIWYIPGIYLSYDIPCHMTGIYCISSYVGYILGIYHDYKLSRVSRCDLEATSGILTHV